MRLVVGLAVALLLTASAAGCFERRGTLAVDLAISDQGAIREFRSINITLDKVRIDARTQNPETLPVQVQRIELVDAAATGETFRMFREEVRSDRYEKITLTVPPGASFVGYLLDGTQVAVVVPNNALVVQPNFELPRGGSATYLLVAKVNKVVTGSGAPTYTVVPDAEASRIV